MCIYKLKFRLLFNFFLVLSTVPIRITGRDTFRFTLSQGDSKIEPQSRYKAGPETFETLKKLDPECVLNQLTKEIIIDSMFLNLKDSRPQNSDPLRAEEIIPFLDPSNIISADFSSSLPPVPSPSTKVGGSNKKKETKRRGVDAEKMKHDLGKYGELKSKTEDVDDSFNQVESANIEDLQGYMDAAELGRPLAEILYLYDDIFVPSKDDPAQLLRFNEKNALKCSNSESAEIEKCAKVVYNSNIGYDKPDWEKVITKWDSLPGIYRRFEHPQHQEAEIKILFKDGGGVENVRHDLENTILLHGRGNPEIRAKWTALGNTWRATGNVFRAIQCFRRALSLWPNDYDVLLNLAVILQNLGYIIDSNAMITEAVRLHPKGALHHFVRGNINADLGNREEAIASYRNALRIQPSFSTCSKRLKELGASPLQNDETGFMGSFGTIEWLDQEFFGISFLMHLVLLSIIVLIYVLGTYATRENKSSSYGSGGFLHGSASNNKRNNPRYNFSRRRVKRK
mmetsp:Transcript_16950/g.20380  ORF Transcript_16950/g.20380 Transcript_16950/m.20380 type:complete len:511 (-) Transcript_16950:899-2431(-)